MSPLDEISCIASFSQVCFSLPGDDGCAFDSHPFGQYNGISYLSACAGDEPLPLHLAKQVPHDYGPTQAIGYLRMPSHQGDSQFRAGVVYLPKYLFRQSRVAPLFRKQDGGKEPERSRAGGDQIISVHMHRVPSYLIGGKGDGIGLDHQIPVVHLQHRSVLPDSGT